MNTTTLQNIKKQTPPQLIQHKYNSNTYKTQNQCSQIQNLHNTDTEPVQHQTTTNTTPIQHHDKMNTPTLQNQNN